MTTLDAAALLTLWERGVHAKPARRGLLLMVAACPHASEEALLQASIGRRDAWLLHLREQWFGPHVECLVDCPFCSTPIEISFRVDQIRCASAEPAQACEAHVGGHPVPLRLPTTADLLAIEDSTDIDEALERLLGRCLREPLTRVRDPALLDAASAEMGASDPQGDVTLDIACPSCASHSEMPFDIVGHLWCEFDHWAQGLLRSVHTLASRYGWSEPSILAMSPARRQAYLQLAGGLA